MSGKHAAKVPEHIRLCVRGVAHLIYDDPTGTGIGFAWNGKVTDPIEVSHGGELTNVVTSTVNGLPLEEWFKEIHGAETVVQMFHGICEQWLAHITTFGGWAQEPTKVVEFHG